MKRKYKYFFKLTFQTIYLKHVNFVSEIKVGT